MAQAKKRPVAKKSERAKKPARTKSSAAKTPSAVRAPKVAVRQSSNVRTPYTPRVQAMVYIFVVLAILFACLAFYRYP